MPHKRVGRVAVISLTVTRSAVAVARKREHEEKKKEAPTKEKKEEKREAKEEKEENSGRTRISGRTRSIQRITKLTSPRKESSRSRERKRAPFIRPLASHALAHCTSPRPRLTRSSARKEEKDQKERERKRSDGEGPDAKRRKIERKKKNTVATVQKDTVSIDEDKENAGVATVTRASKVAQLKPEPYEEINESIFLTQIRDGHDYDGQCSCKDGVCGVSCILRCMTVECDKKTCPSRDNCTNRALQQKKNVKLEVFHTGTEKGFGVRALEPIMKGGFIMEFIGEVMTNTMGEKRSKQYARQFPTRRHQYMMTVTDWRNCPYIIDSTKFGNQSRFTNHSCEPNAICDKWSVDGRFRMGLWAKKKIQAGEEITFDYRFLKYGRTVTNCACGTPKCRQYLSS